jgi:hypothetical protein
MQIRAEQLAAHLARGLKPLYTVHGDEPLQAQEAGDAIRAAARAAGYAERKVFTVSGAHFDWSGVLGAAQEMSLFADRQLIEIRIPSGKPGKDGSEALQRYCENLSDDVLTLVQLPRWTASRPRRLVRRARRRRRDRCAWNRSSARRCRPGWRSAWRARASACRAVKPASTRWPSLPTAWKATCWPRTRSCRSWRCCTRPAS